MNNIAALLAIVRIYCRMEIPPPDHMVRLIKDMGFDEPDVIDALKITKNNYSAACDWLIGNRATLTLHQRRNGTGSGSSVSNGLDGLPSDSPILQALLSSPNVQMSLSNPKIFLGIFSTFGGKFVFVHSICDIRRFFFRLYSLHIDTGGLFHNEHVAGRQRNIGHRRSHIAHLPRGETYPGHQ